MSAFSHPVTGCVLRSDGEDEISGFATLMFTGKVIPGNGGILYIQSLMTSSREDYELLQCVWKVQLYNVDTGAVTTLGQYCRDWNAKVIDGVTGDANVFNAANGVLMSYRLPSSGRYYLQMRYYAADYGQHSRNVACYVQNAYAIVA